MCSNSNYAKRKYSVVVVFVQRFSKFVESRIKWMPTAFCESVMTHHFHLPVKFINTKTSLKWISVRSPKWISRCNQKGLCCLKERSQVSDTVILCIHTIVSNQPSSSELKTFFTLSFSALRRCCRSLLKRLWWSRRFLSLGSVFSSFSAIWVVVDFVV
jgi:hypothetical protein